jgi:Holliday junction resolvase RusA-like endonuclease
MRKAYLKEMPLPPSVNHIYATSWTSKRRFKSQSYLQYERAVIHWKHMNAEALATARELTSKLTEGEAFKIDCIFYFQKSDLISKKKTIKKNDTSNRLKACHDVLSEILDVDDRLFWDGTFVKKMIDKEHPGFVDIIISIFEIEGF